MPFTFSFQRESVPGQRRDTPTDRTNQSIADAVNSKKDATINVKSIFADYSVLTTDEYLLVNSFSASAAIILRLPSASSFTGILTTKLLDSSGNGFTLLAVVGQFIDGAASVTKT